ncbi:MAG: hypothetical protein ACOH12_05420 [Parvibaculaceae bacterium]
MTTARDIITPHIEAIREEARGFQIPEDLLGRVLLEQVIRIWRESRSLEDIREELESTMEHLDPDEDFAFMRP